jgi:hypothetical protein
LGENLVEGFHSRIRIFTLLKFAFLLKYICLFGHITQLSIQKILIKLKKGEILMKSKSITRGFQILTAMVLILVSCLAIIPPQPVSAKVDTTGSTVVANIDNQEFPDDIFRHYVAQTYDLNHDSLLSEYEVSQAINLDISGMGVYDLDGIQNLTELENIDVSDNHISCMDFETTFSIIDPVSFDASGQIVDVYVNEVSQDEYKVTFPWEMFIKNQFGSGEYRGYFSYTSTPEHTQWVYTIINNMFTRTAKDGRITIYCDSSSQELYMIVKDPTITELYFWFETFAYEAVEGSEPQYKYLSGKFVLHQGETKVSYLANQGVIEYTILIPKTITVVGNRESDKFQVAVDTSQDFILEPYAKVDVKIRDTVNKFYLVCADDSLKYNLTETSVLTADIANNPLVAFKAKTDKPIEVFINFDPTPAKYAGEYSDLMIFAITYNNSATTTTPAIPAVTD